MNNSSFGKKIEQKRKLQNVVIVMNEEQAKRYTNKPTVQKIIPINETTCIFLMKRLSVYLDKPITVGTSVCEIAKAVMYDMHYSCIKKFYGKRAILLYTDTGMTCTVSCYTSVNMVNYLSFRFLNLQVNY